MTLVKNAPIVGAKNNTVVPKVEAKPTTEITAKSLVSVPEKMAALNAIPLDERLHRLNQLFEIQGKYNRLQASLQKLQNFKFKKNGEYSSLRITDDGRSDFSTGNPEVIEAIVKTLVSTIESKIKALEPQLMW